jgi:hypothetical protein
MEEEEEEEEDGEGRVKGWFKIGFDPRSCDWM